MHHELRTIYVYVPSAIRRFDGAHHNDTVGATSGSRTVRTSVKHVVSSCNYQHSAAGSDLHSFVDRVTQGSGESSVQGNNNHGSNYQHMTPKHNLKLRTTESRRRCLSLGTWSRRCPAPARFLAECECRSLDPHRAALG